MLGLALKERAPDEAMEHRRDLLARVEVLLDAAEKVLEAAKLKSDLRASTNAINSTVKVLELLARLRGELQPQNAGGIHLNFTKTTTNVLNVHGDDSDVELALMVQEATHNWNPNEIQRLRMLTEGAPTNTETDTARNSAVSVK